MRPMLAAVLVVLAGCSAPDGVPGDDASAQGTAGATADATASAPAAPPAPPVPGSRAPARAVTEETDTYVFEYAYPAAAAAIPQLAAWLEKDLAAKKAELAADAAAGRRDAQGGGYPFHPYTNSTSWSVVTDLPGWLSLSADLGFFTGGAHPNYVFDSLLWDRAAGVRREPVDLFTSRAALSAAIGRDFCAALDRQRAEKRGEPVVRSSEMFSDCIDPAAQTVILGSAGREGFDRIGILIAPYEAGPYAEGSYEVTLPVTPAVLAAVKPEFRAAFRVR